MNQIPLPSENALLSYQELKTRPPQNPPPEEGLPEIHAGVLRPDENDVLILEPENNQGQAPPPIFLVRKDFAFQAYAQIEEMGSIRTHYGLVCFAVVYKADEPGNDAFHAPSEDEATFVAIKCLSRPDADRIIEGGGRENYVTEILRMQQLHDEDNHVLECIEVLVADDMIFIVTPKACQLGTLADFVRMNAKPVVDRAWVYEIFKQIMAILVHLERHGVCHHDLKAENLLFVTPSKLAVFDFAMSHRLPYDVQGRRTLVTRQGVFGTPTHMAPELYEVRMPVVDNRGRVSLQVWVRDGPYCGSSTDLWAAGVMLFDMVAGMFVRTGDRIVRLALYMEPTPMDPLFHYNIYSGYLNNMGGLLDPQAEPNYTHYVMGLVAQMDERLRHGTEEDRRRAQHDFQFRAELLQAQRKLYRESLQADDQDLAEFLEKVLKFQFEDRWSLGQAMQSAFFHRIHHGR